MSLIRRLDSIENKRDRLMDRLAEMDAGRMAARPRPDKWSIQEIVEHLVLSEGGVFGDLEELGDRTSLRRGAKHLLLYQLVMLILRFDIPVRVPSRSMIPRGELALPELGVRWEANHRQMRQWITTADPAQLDQPLFRHPVAGPMTIAQSLRMLEVHLDRHTRQIRAIERRS